MELVLDASTAVSWVIPDEGEAKAERFLERIGGEDVLWVPAVWWYEISNALAIAERRRRIAEADIMRAFDLFGGLPLRTDAPEDVSACVRYFVLARQHGLTAYDAAYLELAERKGLALATLDKRLRAAAASAGLETLAG